VFVAIVESTLRCSSISILILEKNSSDIGYFLCTR
jgi:hypothetical protein